MTHRPTPTITPRHETPSRALNLKDGDLASPVPLNDFMNELGVILQLPKRTITKAMPVIVDAPPRGRRWRARSVLLSSVALLLAASVALDRFGPAPRAEDLPVELRGDWRTSHPQYRERKLSFTSDRVGLAMSPGIAPTLHAVTTLTRRDRGDTTMLAMTYEQDGSPVEFRVSLVRGPRPQLWLSNPPDVIWVPVVDPPTAGGAAVIAAGSVSPK